MPLISHRGAAGLAPENTLASIRLAATFKPVFIEVDVHCTSDGTFVIHHGDVKQTLTGERMPKTFDELAEHVPNLLTLQKLLKSRLLAPLILDIKCADDVALLIVALKAYGVPSSTAFTSPHANALYELKTAFPFTKTFISQPYHYGPISSIELARDNNFSGISLNRWWLGPFVALLCNHYKKEIMVYTINNSFWLWVAQALFKNAYICTDFPDRYRKHFKK